MSPVDGTGVLHLWKYMMIYGVRQMRLVVLDLFVRFHHICFYGLKYAEVLRLPLINSKGLKRVN